MKKAIFIGQAMPKVERDPYDWPSLNKWLYSIGLSESLIKKNMLYSALVDYFPGSNNGSHITPSREEIAEQRERLKKTINSFRPKIVVPIGRLSISYCLNQKIQPLANNIAKVYKTNPYNLYTKKATIIPLPHPSGASTWVYKNENKKLLDSALSLLKHNIFSS